MGEGQRTKGGLPCSWLELTDAHTNELACASRLRDWPLAGLALPCCLDEGSYYSDAITNQLTCSTCLSPSLSQGLATCRLCVPLLLCVADGARCGAVP